MRFKIKKDVSLATILFVISVFTLYIFLINYQTAPWVYGPLLVVVGCMVGLIVWFYVVSEYIIEDDVLFIRFGFLREAIPLEAIEKVKSATNLSMSTTFSRHRLKIQATGYPVYYISPVPRDAFIDQLKQIIDHKKMVL